MFSPVTLERGDVKLCVEIGGEGPLVLLLPSAGRGASDFSALASVLEARRYSAAAVNPRGAGGSTGPLEGLTLHDLAADVSVVVEELAHGPAHLVGHAFGNRVARCLATDRPDLVRSVTLLAAGGRVAGTRREPFLPEGGVLTSDGFEAMRRAMFSPRSAASVAEAWRSGWWFDTLRAQGAAVFGTPVDEWWSAGVAPILVIQGMDDEVAPPENARLLLSEHPDRVALVEIEGAGHAILIERPNEVAEHLLRFLRRVDG